MNLRERSYSPRFWFRLHHYSFDPSTLLATKPKAPTNKKIDSCLKPIFPHIQMLIYAGAIDKRKGEIRAGKYPLSAEQFATIGHLGATHKYDHVPLLERCLDLEYRFDHKGYARSIHNVQFRLQKRQPAILHKKCILLLRIRFQQKTPCLLWSINLSRTE